MPPNFPVIDAIPSHCLQRGWTLEKEMQEGNIYLQDYEMMDGVSTVMKDGVPLAVPSAMVLFYLRPSQDLVPIAIQLGQKPGYDCPIWTPGDTGWYSLQSYTQSSLYFAQLRTGYGPRCGWAVLLAKLVSCIFTFPWHTSVWRSLLSPCLGVCLQHILFTRF